MPAVRLLKVLGRLRLTYPQRADALIFDKVSGQHFPSTLFPNHTTAFFETRDGLIHLFLARKFIKFFRKCRSVRLAYWLSYVEATNPRLCVASNEFMSLFGELKQYLSSTKFIVFSNSYPYGTYNAQDWPDWPNNDKRLKVDYFVVPSPIAVEFYKGSVECEFVPLGNPWLNVRLGYRRTDRRVGIGLISEFRTVGRGVEDFNTCIPYIQQMSDLARHRGGTLKIGLASSRYDKSDIKSKELSFFTKYVTDFECSTLPTSIYLGSCRLVICFTSFAGLELICTGTRVFFIDFQAEIGRARRSYFGMTFGISGPFWDPGHDLKMVQDKIDNIINMTDAEWADVIAKYPLPITYFDRDNVETRRFLSEMM